MTTKKYYKNPKFGHVNGETLLSPPVRCAWPHLVTPKEAPPLTEQEKAAGKKKGDPRYELVLLLPKDKADIIEYVQKLKIMTDEMLPQFNEKRAATLGTCALFGKYGDGDEDDHEKYPFYKGCHKLTGRNPRPIKVVDRERKIIEPNSISGGMIVRVAAYPLITASGISYRLEAVQLWEDDGVRFAGAARDAVELFDACEDEPETDSQNNGATDGTEPPLNKKVKKGKEAALDLL